MNIAITGHRPNKLGNDYDLTSLLIDKIEYEILKILTDEEYSGRDVKLITGMALGIDTLFAKIAVELKLPFIAAIPCTQQHAKWFQKSKETYLDLINHPLCEKVYVTDKPYTPDCMQKRNEWMVDECDLLIAVWDGSSGGTKNCYDYAKARGKKIFRINPNEL